MRWKSALWRQAPNVGFCLTGCIQHFIGCTASKGWVRVPFNAFGRVWSLHSDRKGIFVHLDEGPAVKLKFLDVTIGWHASPIGRWNVRASTDSTCVASGGKDGFTGWAWANAMRNVMSPHIIGIDGD